jgi:hypothetical protein
MTTKIDFKQRFKQYYNPSIKGFHVVDVPAMNFLMIDGKGDPNSSVEYQSAVEVLYSVSYGIKFDYKSQGLDHIVPPLEGLWWMEDMNEFTLANKSRWEWTMMIMQPEWVNKGIVDKIIEKVWKKNNNPALLKLRFEHYNEGLSVQTIYMGTYENEAPIIAQMHRYILENRYHPSGKHHEIYLSDPRKTAPEKNKTVLRQPIQTI